MMNTQNSPEKVYKSNYLTNVIFRVDFPIILELAGYKPPSEFQKRINDKFPITNEKKGKILDIEVVRGHAEAAKLEGRFSWEFINKEKTKKIIIDQEFIAIEYLKYEHFEEFVKNIKFIFENFIDLYPSLKITKRIGLRYINQIRLDSGDPLDWNKFIHPSLFSNPSNFIPKNEDILRSMHLLMTKGEDYTLKFQFGLFNSEFLSPITKKEFVLDYDCYTHEEREVSEIFTIARNFNEIIYVWFEKSILDGLREKMRDFKNEE